LRTDTIDTRVSRTVARDGRCCLRYKDCNFDCRQILYISFEYWIEFFSWLQAEILGNVCQVEIDAVPLTVEIDPVNILNSLCPDAALMHNWVNWRFSIRSAP
jgi:hypothetical protein